MAAITPPPIKPAEPGVSAGAAATVARRLGASAFCIDASIGWHRYALDPERLQARGESAEAGVGAADLALGRAARHLAQRPWPLRRAETYRDRRVYTSAIDHLENGLRLATLDFPELRVGIGSLALRDPARRLESSAVLAELAEAPGPFDAYFGAELIPALADAELDSVGVSLTFLDQAPAAFRLGRLLGEALPGVERVLGGPLVDCWAAVGIGLDRPPFELFDRVLAGGEGAIAAWLGVEPGPSGPGEPLAIGLDDVPWSAYLAPEPIVPAALGRGCSWRRCTFCPDHLHPAHRPCGRDRLEDWLRAVAARFPDGATLHLTDSALPPKHLESIAAVIAGDSLPLRWHGFVRVEDALADRGLVERLAAGGCAMLQLGVESGSPEILRRLGKGTAPDLARRVLGATAAAGIRNQVYLLFGVPGETDADRELTLALIERSAESIHALNPALLNLPRQSPMHAHPERFGITRRVPFGADTDLSLYDDFYCGDTHPRTEARRWLDRRFFKSPAVRGIRGHLRTPFKANHLSFLCRWRRW